MTAIVPQPDVFPEAIVRRLVDDLAAIPDHRDRRGRVYPLASLLAIHVLAAVGDGNSPEDAADFARGPCGLAARAGPSGRPHSQRPDPAAPAAGPGPGSAGGAAALVMRLAAACEAMAEAGEEEEKPEEKEEAAEPPEACAVDGKSVRRSGDAARGLRRTHIVSARLDGGLTIGQAAVPAKGNELTAIRQLLPALALKDRVVSIDAMGCRTDVARTIADADGWYLLAVTDGEASLHATCSATSPTWTAPAPWPTTGTRPWSGGTDAPSGAPARSWAATTVSWTKSIPTNAGRCWAAPCAWSPNAPCATARPAPCATTLPTCP